MQTKIFLGAAEIQAFIKRHPEANDVTLLVLLTDYINQIVPLRYPGFVAVSANVKPGVKSVEVVIRNKSLLDN